MEAGLTKPITEFEDFVAVVDPSVVHDENAQGTRIRRTFR
jgi:hypothetical protein